MTEYLASSEKWTTVNIVYHVAKCWGFINYNHGIKQIKDEELLGVWKELLAI